MVSADEEIENRGFRVHEREAYHRSRDPNLGDDVKPGTEVRWTAVWVVIKASAERRLGKPLLKAYLLLAVFGAVTVAISIVVMHL
jgi:hypothetical protein